MDNSIDKSTSKYFSNFKKVVKTHMTNQNHTYKLNEIVTKDNLTVMGTNYPTVRNEGE